MIDAPLIREPPLASVLAWMRERTAICAWWLGGRAVVLVSAVIVHVAGPRRRLSAIEQKHVLGALQSWDGRWYRIVAADGYLLVPGHQSDPAFFPLFPALLRVMHTLGVGYAVAGLVLANGAFLVALLAFHELTATLFDGGFARRATAYLAIFPFGYVFSMTYPESIVLAAMTLSALAAMRGRWLPAGALAAAAALARPEGVFVALPLVALAWQTRRTLPPIRRGCALGAALAPFAAAAAYPLYLDHVLHNPLAWNRAEQAWGRRFSLLGPVHAIERVGQAFAGNAWVVRDIAATILYVVLLYAAARAGAPRAWIAAGTAIVVLPVFSGAFTSIGRFGLLAVPVYWGLAAIGRRPRIDMTIRALSVALLAAATITIPLVFP